MGKIEKNGGWELLKPVSAPVQGLFSISPLNLVARKLFSKVKCPSLAYNRKSKQYEGKAKLISKNYCNILKIEYRVFSNDFIAEYKDTNTPLTLEVWYNFKNLDALTEKLHSLAEERKKTLKSGKKVQQNIFKKIVRVHKKYFPFLSMFREPDEHGTLGKYILPAWEYSTPSQRKKLFKFLDRYLSIESFLIETRGGKRPKAGRKGIPAEKKQEMVRLNKSYLQAVREFFNLKHPTDDNIENIAQKHNVNAGNLSDLTKNGFPKQSSIDAVVEKNALQRPVTTGGTAKKIRLDSRRKS